MPSRFYTLLVLSTALFDKPPFKNLIANGMVLAADGQKMSKRKKNYPDPMLVRRPPELLGCFIFEHMLDSVTFLHSELKLSLFGKHFVWDLFVCRGLPWVSRVVSSDTMLCALQCRFTAADCQGSRRVVSSDPVLNALFKRVLQNCPALGQPNMATFFRCRVLSFLVYKNQKLEL